MLQKQKISPFNTTKLVTMTQIFVMPRPNNSLLATILWLDKVFFQSKISNEGVKSKHYFGKTHG